MPSRHALDRPDADTSHDLSGPRPSDPERRRRRRWLITAVVILAPLSYVGWNAVGLLRTWSSVERQSYDRMAFDQLPPVTFAPPTESAGALPDETMSDLLPDPASLDADDRYDTYMVVGSDEGDSRADVIILVMLPLDRSAPLMVSLPRDLFLPNRCTQGLTRLNANYNGCGTAINGATQLSGAVEDFTGIEVDHFALFTMDGFARIIDEIGGTQICVEHPVRDGARLNLPAGCTQADGEVALGWVRSRTTQEHVDGRWRTVTNVSDLTRNQRQQDLMLSMLDKAASFNSPQELTRFVHSLGDTFTLDDRLGLREAVDLAWDNRNVRPDSIIRMTIPVEPYETPGGAQVLLPTKPFDEVLAEHIVSEPTPMAAPQ